MGLRTPEEMYNNAMEKNFALGAFNVFSMETLQAVLNASEKLDAPVIIQVSMGARKYVQDLSAFVAAVKAFAEKSKAQVFLQHDHCSCVEDCIIAIDQGFQAVMFDGSHLPYEENIEKTSKVVEYAHSRGVWVEAELGRIPGFEDLVYSGHAELTDPEKAKEFITRTNCDSLAVAVGTAHGGVEADDYLPFHFEILEKIVKTIPGYPFVLHGGASLPPDIIDQCNKAGGKVEYLKMCSEADVAKATRMGIRKVNMDVDNFVLFTAAIREFFLEKPAVYDPRKYLTLARSAFQAEVEHKIKTVLHSEGMAL